MSTLERHEPQHEYASIREVPAPFPHGAYRFGSSLDKQLTKFKRDGRKVLDFWRVDGRWMFKLMAAR
jgi:hypothetical protein